jgi:pimeloyl-ACP methyl ester carboxylesterase
MISTEVTPTSKFISAPDGLKLHVRCWGPRAPKGTPVICLTGLARTVSDFDALAPALAEGGARRVIALDYRGRGQSEYDPNPENYNLAIELADVLAVATALECLPAVFVGTSRGGILTMLLAAQRPNAIAGAVLNDIGPVLEPEGLMRIKGYVGKLPQPRSFDDGAEVLRRLFGGQFPNLTKEDWLKSAHRSFQEEKGRLIPTYDVNLAKTLESIDPEKPVPPMWKEFEAMRAMRVLAIRGENSDLLSSATFDEMQARHPELETLLVADQGHAPLLAEADTIARIGAFVRACDKRH